MTHIFSKAVNDLTKAYRSGIRKGPRTFEETRVDLIAKYEEHPGPSPTIKNKIRLAIPERSDSEDWCRDLEDWREFIWKTKFIDTEVMGTYSARDVKDPHRGIIKIYVDVIKEAAGLLGCEAEILKRIVVIHETAHAFHDQSVSDKGIGPLKKAKFCFGEAKTFLKEHMAQLLTLITLLGEMDAAPFNYRAGVRPDDTLNIFFRLMAKQSPKYVLPPQVETTELEDLLVIADRLFALSDRCINLTNLDVRKAFIV